MADKKDKKRLDGPMSYSHWAPIAPEELEEARRRNSEAAEKRHRRNEGKH